MKRPRFSSVGLLVFSSIIRYRVLIKNELTKMNCHLKLGVYLRLICITILMAIQPLINSVASEIFPILTENTSLIEALKASTTCVNEKTSLSELEKPELHTITENNSLILKNTRIFRIIKEYYSVILSKSLNFA